MLNDDRGRPACFPGCAARAPRKSETDGPCRRALRLDPQRVPCPADHGGGIPLAATAAGEGRRPPVPDPTVHGVSPGPHAVLRGLPGAPAGWGLCGRLRRRRALPRRDELPAPAALCPGRAL